ELIPALRHYGLGFIPYFPLQNGLLTGKYRQGHAPAEAKITNLKRYLLGSAPWEALARYEKFAAERGVTPTALALGWLLAQPTVTSVITGVTVPGQRDENLAARRRTPTPGAECHLRGDFTGDPPGGPGVVDTGDDEADGERRDAKA